MIRWAGGRAEIAGAVKGEGDARAAIRLIRREFGIDADDGRTGGAEEPDILAADG